MQESRQDLVPTHRRLVGVATETATFYGRSILLGVARYANLQRRWILHKDTLGTAARVHWPDCDGTIVGGVWGEALQSAKAHSRHLISCSGNFDPEEMPVVRLDDGATGAMAAEHLIERGLKKFSFYGSSRSPEDAHAQRPRYTFTRRVRGFQQRLERHGFSCESPAGPAGPTTQSDFMTQAHHPQLVRWLHSLPYPIGIMAVDDMYANDLAEACNKAQIDVPNQVAIIGINNDELLCESAWPALSSVECNFTRMGFLAAKILDRMMSGETLKREERLIELPPVRVHQRMSTDVLAVDQPEVADAIRFIHDHACDPCSVEDVLRAVPVSRSTLERQFVHHLGRSPHEEIVRVRAQTARRLLAQPDLTINEVAVRCGFASVPSFSRFFDRAVGLPPATFRRGHVL